MPSQITVFGAGAVGGAIAARLVASGRQVAVVARGAHLKAIQIQGITLKAETGTTTVPVHATDDITQLSQPDYLLVTLKAGALMAASRDIARLIGPHTLPVFVMNGVPWWFACTMNADIRNAIRRLDPYGEFAALFPLTDLPGESCGRAARSLRLA